MSLVRNSSRTIEFASGHRFVTIFITRRRRGWNLRHMNWWEVGLTSWDFSYFPLAQGWILYTGASGIDHRRVPRKIAIRKGLFEDAICYRSRNCSSFIAMDRHIGKACLIEIVSRILLHLKRRQSSLPILFFDLVSPFEHGRKLWSLSFIGSIKVFPLQHVSMPIVFAVHYVEVRRIFLLHFQCIILCGWIRIDGTASLPVVSYLFFEETVVIITIKWRLHYILNRISGIFADSMWLIEILFGEGVVDSVARSNAMGSVVPSRSKCIFWSSSAILKSIHFFKFRDVYI